jgi:hypothetical protein
MIEMPETHQQGFIQVHNQELIDRIDLSDADFGLQVSSDGRVWVCIDGIAFIRFKPKSIGERSGPMPTITDERRPDCG